MFDLIWVLALGALVGWLAGKVMGREGGLVRNIVVGVVGSGLGSFLFGLAGFAAFGFFARLLVSLVGACVLLWLARRVLG